MKYLRTSELARAVGIHPNTVRLYWPIGSSDSLLLSGSPGIGVMEAAQDGTAHHVDTGWRRIGGQGLLSWTLHIR
jgi:hypothetical protein